MGERIRRYTPTECARLQTIPEWYKWQCPQTQQYKMLGNGWTVEVIKHILQFLKPPTTMRMKVYISIPMQGRDLEQQRSHADAVATMLSKNGQTPVNPFNIHAGNNPTYADHMAADIRALLECDGIYLCKGWENSMGCQLEYHCARIYGKEIHYEE